MREAIRIEDEKREARKAELTPFMSGVIAVDLGKLKDEEYAQLLQDAKDAQTVRLAREKAEKKAAAAPDKAKLKKLVLDIDEMNLPTFSDALLSEQVGAKFGELGDWLAKRAEEL
jgi:hypothetical protein